MQATKIINEIKSLALKEIAGSLIDLIDRVRGGQVEAKFAAVEVAAHKHVIQSIALDWTFNGKTKFIKSVKQVDSK